MKRGFTLVELLVTIGVIALLIGLLMPVLAKAREKGNQTVCMGQLRDIGALFQMYLTDSKNRLPRVNTMPSVQPPLNTAPSIVELLSPHIKGSTKVFQCRSDRIKQPSAGAPSGFETYYEREGSSYMYNPMLSSMYAGHQINDTSLYKAGKQNLQVIMNDYEAFHAKPGTPGSMNYLFADFHVGDLATP